MTTFLVTLRSLLLLATCLSLYIGIAVPANMALRTALAVAFTFIHLMVR
jgi:uncharacterized membrane protein